jgi:hypothetical protein
LVYKYVSGHGGLKPSGIFSRIENRDGARTCLAAGKDNLKLPVARLDIRKNSFAVRTVSKWNSLPENVKQSRTCEGFKRALQEHYRNGARPA